MTNPCLLIPTNFKVPKGCRHEFVLIFKGKWIGRITGLPGRKKLQFDTFRIGEPVDATGEERQAFHRCSFDWMQESVEHLRFICGGQK